MTLFLGFAPVALPAAAYRRTWLVDAVEDVSVAQRCLKILGVLDPKATRGLNPAQPVACVLALLDYADSLGMPLYTDNLRDGLTYGDATPADVLMWGVPIEPEGWHPDRSTAACDLAVLTVGTNWADWTTPADAEWNSQDATLGKWVASWWPGRHKPADQPNWRPPKPPRGYAFRPPWHGLPDLARYVRGQSGHEWLTVSFEEQDYSGAVPWDVEHLRWLKRTWDKAAPVWKRITDLTQYVEAFPRQRMQTLDLALRGDRDTLYEICQRTKGRGRTLAQVFARAR